VKAAFPCILKQAKYVRVHKKEQGEENPTLTGGYFRKL
jgi:hypothetical protein